MRKYLRPRHAQPSDIMTKYWHLQSSHSRTAQQSYKGEKIPWWFKYVSDFCVDLHSQLPCASHSPWAMVRTPESPYRQTSTITEAVVEIQSTDCEPASSFRTKMSSWPLPRTVSYGHRGRRWLEMPNPQAGSPSISGIPQWATKLPKWEVLWVPLSSLPTGPSSSPITDNYFSIDGMRQWCHALIFLASGDLLSSPPLPHLWVFGVFGLLPILANSSYSFFTEYGDSLALSCSSSWKPSPYTLDSRSPVKSKNQQEQLLPCGPTLPLCWHPLIEQIFVRSWCLPFLCLLALVHCHILTILVTKIFPDSAFLPSLSSLCWSKPLSPLVCFCLFWAIPNTTSIVLKPKGYLSQLAAFPSCGFLLHHLW